MEECIPVMASFSLGQAKHCLEVWQAGQSAEAPCSGSAGCRTYQRTIPSNLN